MLDVFSNVQYEVLRNDLFGTYNEKDKFLWAVGVFNGNGAHEIIKYALDARLETFFPHRLNKLGNFIPLWRNYLFIEYIPPMTAQVCRQSSKFLGFINFNGQPELVYRNAIDECLKLLQLGKYNFTHLRRSHVSKGTYVRIMNDNNFQGKLVKILCDVTPEMHETKRIPVELGSMRMMLELRKLFI